MSGTHYVFSLDHRSMFAEKKKAPLMTVDSMDYSELWFPNLGGAQENLEKLGTFFNCQTQV